MPKSWHSIEACSALRADLLSCIPFSTHSCLLRIISIVFHTDIGLVFPSSNLNFDYNHPIIVGSALYRLLQINLRPLAGCQLAASSARTSHCQWAAKVQVSQCMRPRVVDKALCLHHLYMMQVRFIFSANCSTSLVMAASNTCSLLSGNGHAA